HGLAAIPGNHGGQPHGLLAKLGTRHEVVEEPDTLRLLRFDDPAGKQELLGHGPSHLVGQGPRAVDTAVGGGEESKARVLAPHAHVERGGEHGGAAVREAVDHADGGLGAGADLVAAASPQGAASIQLLLAEATVVLTLLMDVAARGEGARPRPGDDDAAHLIVRAHARDRFVQLAAQLVAHGVELRGAIHGEDRHPLRLLAEDTFAGHLFLLASGLWLGSLRRVYLCAAARGQALCAGGAELSSWGVVQTS